MRETSDARNFVIAPVLWTVLTELYISDELDAVCTGLNRHKRFAFWVLENEGTVREKLNARWTVINEKVNELEQEKAALQARIERVKMGWV